MSSDKTLCGLAKYVYLMRSPPPKRLQLQQRHGRRKRAEDPCDAALAFRAFGENCDTFASSARCSDVKLALRDPGDVEAFVKSLRLYMRRYSRSTVFRKLDANQ